MSMLSRGTIGAPGRAGGERNGGGEGGENTMVDCLYIARDEVYQAWLSGLTS